MCRTIEIRAGADDEVTDTVVIDRSPGHMFECVTLSHRSNPVPATKPLAAVPVGAAVLSLLRKANYVATLVGVTV